MVNGLFVSKVGIYECRIVQIIILFGFIFIKNNIYIVYSQNISMAEEIGINIFLCKMCFLL